MKIFSKQSITSAQNTGTTWYEITRDDILKNSLWAKNIWINYRISEYPLYEALNFKSLEGSFATEDVLYYLVTDYNTISVNGEEVEPDEASDYFEIRDLQSYISKTDVQEQAKRITDSDISWEDVDIEEIAKELLNFNDLESVAKDAEDIGLIEL